MEPGHQGHAGTLLLRWGAERLLLVRYQHLRQDHPLGLPQDGQAHRERPRGRHGERTAELQELGVLLRI